MREKTILISSAGRRVELIHLFRESAANLGINLRIIASDAQPEWSPACQIADRFYQVLHCNDPAFISQVLEISKQEQVDLIIPTIDTELSYYTQAKKSFAAIGTRLHVADEQAIAIFRNKFSTMQKLELLGIPIPQTFLFSEFSLEKHLFFPLILKPLAGSCSQGIIRLFTANDFLALSPPNPHEYIVQTLLPGSEYTVNCYFNQSNLVAAVPHYRKTIRAGEVCFAETHRLQTIDEIARKIGTAFNIHGAICFQGFYHKDNFHVIEINGRFGGGYPIAHRAGAPMTTWLLEELLGIAPSYSNEWREGVKMLRYDAAVFTGL